MLFLEIRIILYFVYILVDLFNYNFIIIIFHLISVIHFLFTDYVFYINVLAFCIIVIIIE